MKSYFRTSYLEAMQQFANVAAHAGFSLQKILLQKNGGSQENPLYTFVAAKGPANAESLLITTSGVHGVELPAGAALQALWMRACRSTTHNARMIHVCAVNPYGALHALRTNEDGVDLNRNFIRDFQIPPKSPADFSSLRHALVPRGFGWSNAAAWAKIFAYLGLRGVKRFKNVLMAGQYEFPSNLFFGGIVPAASRILWENVVDEQCHHARRIIHLDLHTGMGKSGQAHIVPQTQLAGSITGYWQDMPAFKDKALLPLTIEFGTFPGLPMFAALRARHILKTRYNDNHPSGGVIIQRCVEAFCPDVPKWRYDVATQGKRLFRKAVSCLENGTSTLSL